MNDKFRFNGTGLEIGIPLSDADSSAISQWAENAADLARKHEMERIIKLLEERKALLEDPNNHYFSLTYIQQLIKGETNE